MPLDFKHSGSHKRKRANIVVGPGRAYKRVRTGAPSVTAVKALAKVKYLERLCKPELKYNDSTVLQTTFSSSGIIKIQPTITQGVSSQERVGLSIRLIDQQFKCNVYKSTNATTTFSRVIFFVDKQQQTDAKTSPANVLSQVHTLGQINRQLGVGRFRILFDKKFTLTTYNPAFMFDVNLKLNITQRYNGNLSTDYQKNFIYMLLVSAEPTNLPTMNYSWRIRFTDN